MNGFWGADTEALRTMGGYLARRANLLAELEGRLSSTIDSVEWVGEDAEHFRAEWSRLVRNGLQDQEVELRIQARRLTQHADEQDEASSPDGWSVGWSTPGDFLRDLATIAPAVIGDLLGGGGGALDRVQGPLADLLREVLSTPEGRAAFLGSFLGSILGGLVADMISRAIGIGLALENLLTGLGIAAGLSNLIGATGEVPTEPIAARPEASEPAPEPASAGEETASGGSEESSSGGESEGSGGGSGSSGSSGGGSGGSSGGGGSGGGASDGGAGEASGGAEATTGGDATGGAGGGSRLQATSEGPAQSGGSWGSGQITAVASDEPMSLLERLMEMVGDAMGAGSGTTASIGEDIGFSGSDVTGR